MNNDKEYSWAIVVLGGGLHKEKDKYILPEIVKYRVDKAKELLEEKEEALLITSSRWTYRIKYKENTPSEAVLMKEYAIRRGIEEESILLEDCSLETFGNAYYSRVIHIDPLGIKNIAVVTSEFHMPKTKLFFDVVFGDKYHIEYYTSPNKGIDKEELEKRMLWEEAVIKYFKQKILPEIKKGDLRSIHHYMFHKNPAYNGGKHIDDQELIELRKKRLETLCVSWVLSWVPEFLWINH